MEVSFIVFSANDYISSQVNSIIDIDGNEYLLKSYTLGAKSYGDISLFTDVPIKCTFTFGGVLPAVKMIKLLKFDYVHPTTYKRNFVEFRDLSISWQ
jgi:hypothetical protein